MDVLKVEMHTKRACWVPATVKKLTSLSVHLMIDFEKGTHTIDRKNMLVFPFEEKKGEYEWRINLKAGDKIDIQDNYGNWIVGTITERR